MNIGGVKIRSNPQMQGVLEALTNIVNGLRGAKDNWWEDEDEKEIMTQHNNEDDYDDDDEEEEEEGGGDKENSQGNDSDEEENGHFPSFTQKRLPPPAMTQTENLSPSRFAASSRKKRQKLSVKFAVSGVDDNEEEDEDEDKDEDEVGEINTLSIRLLVI
jgi:hypothetical protein